MYVMALVDFHDNLKNVNRKCGEEFTVTEDRFEEINRIGQEKIGAPIVSVVQREPFSPEGMKADKKRKSKRPTKAKLLAEAEALGIEVPDGATASAIAKLVAEAKLG